MVLAKLILRHDEMEKNEPGTRGQYHRSGITLTILISELEKQVFFKLTAGKTRVNTPPLLLPFPSGSVMEEKSPALTTPLITTWLLLLFLKRFLHLAFIVFIFHGV